MSNNKDFKVKNGIQPTVYHEGLGTVVSGSVGYGLADASYDSVSFSTASQDTSAQDFFFKADGTKMYVLGSTGDAVYEYNLSSAWDVSTASYSQNFSVATQETTPRGVFFKTDGTKMYVTGSSSDSVHEYNVSTAWDISTASFTSTFGVSGQDTSPQGVSFKDDGTKMYMIGSTNEAVYEYTLSTAWDISTASYSQNFSVAAQTSATTGLFFKPDGTEMFVADNANDAVLEYDLSTAWDVSSASYSQSADISSQVATILGLFFKDDGTKMYVADGTTDTIYQYSTVLTTAELDLSTGSVFDYTPTSDVQVTLSNPAASGTVSGATLLLTGAEGTGVASTFSTTLYTGTGAEQTITNGIDLAGDGGIVWVKCRSDTADHRLIDTDGGANNILTPNANSAYFNNSTIFSSFNSDGFSVATDVATNGSGRTYASWTFKKQSSFFDVVTYTGNGVAGRSISHSLNSDVGTILFKRTDSASNWIVWHRSAGGAYGFLDADDAFTADSGISNPTTTAFTIESTINAGWNASGGTYVAYLFAHDTDASSLIQCGSYTGTGSAGKAVTLGWEPQWLMIKRTDVTNYSWEIMDTQRGFTSGNDKVLRANSSGAEATAYDYGTATSTGFELTNDISVNSSGGSYIYMAIRAESLPTITYDPTLEWSGGTAPTAPAKGETDVVTFNTRDGGSTYQGVLAIDGAK